MSTTPSALEFSTFFKVKNPTKEGMKKVIEDLSTVNFQTREKLPYAYFYDDDKKTLRLPRGIGKESIFDYFEINDIKNGGFLDVESDIKFNMVHDPFPKQSKVIDGIYQKYAKGRNQSIINLPTGRGKTYSGIFINHKLRVSPLIFVYENTLQLQWADSYVEHTDIDEEKIFIVNGSKDVLDLIEHGHKYDIFIITHATVRSFIKNYSMKQFNKFLLSCDIGFKIYDEFDRESQNMFNVDCHTSVRYNLYLSATPFRSSKWDDEAFQYAFNNVPKIGLEFYEDETPNRDAEFIFYHSAPSDEQEEQCHAWKFNHQWLNDRSKKKFNQYFDNHSYHIYLYGTENNYNPKKSFMKAIDKPIKEIKEAINEEQEKKNVICTGRIDNCIRMKRLLLEEYDFDKDDIAIYNSDVDDSKKQKALDYPVIITLSNSIGRGLDIENIYSILDLEAYGSESIFAQLVGRIGRKGGMRGMYYKIIDLSFYNCYRYYKNLKPQIRKQFDDVNYIKLETEEMEDRLKGGK